MIYISFDLSMKKVHKSMFGTLKDNPTEIDSIRTYLRLYRGEDVALDDDVCKDIGLNDLFGYSNRCITPVGELMLYDRFRQMKRSRRVVDDEKVISQIREDEDFRAKVESALDVLNLKKRISVSELLNMSVQVGQWHKFSWLVPLLELAVFILLLIFLPPAASIFYAVAVLTLNACMHYANKPYIDIYIRPLVQLDRMRQASVKLSELDRLNDLQEVSLSINNLAKLSKRLRTFSLNGILESDIMALFYILIEFVKILLCIEPIKTYAILKKMDDVSKDSRTLLEYVGGWDVLYSIASFRKWMDSCGLVWSLPAFVPQSKALKADNIYHPLINNCVPNSIKIDKSVIITGSNMSGKSSFLRTLAINILSSNALNMSFASSMSLPECRLHSVLSVSDNLDEGKSYYMSEVLRIQSVIDKCTSADDHITDFVFIDEIFKGTNTVERISIADAVIRYLSSLENTVAVVSTHDIELARGLEKILDTYHFNETIDSEQIRFSYRLIPGVVYTRNAISLLRLCGYPSSILDKAEENARNIHFSTSD